MKKTILFIVLVFYIFSFSACKDDDWATYKNVDYELSTKIEGNIFLISEIESELLSVILKYDNDVKLTYAQYIFEDENNGVAEFQFFRKYKKIKISTVIACLIIAPFFVAVSYTHLGQQAFNHGLTQSKKRH